MLFNSFEFLVFLPVVFLLYWFVFQKKLVTQNLLLLVASYFFYGWWSIEFLGLLAISTLLDYLYGFSVASPNRKKAKLFLWLSIVNNLGILAIFKYYNFFAEQFQSSMELLGFKVNPILLQIALPVGISFYTFHGMSYVFDIYREKQKPIRSFIDYAVFVSFFPLLVAGPIERANHLLPQIQRIRHFNYTQAVEGMRLILWGFFKKVVIADNLAGIADEILGNYHDVNAFTLFMGIVAFSFQIYGDFSGYSDIALGTAKLFGFELLSNFKFPYFSRNIAEFWRRWHISLSSWFKDYLYIPLGGSRNGKLQAVRNTFIIFLVSGFWHGASWNFIIWGGVHALGFMPLLLLNRNRTFVNETIAENRSLPTFREFRQVLFTFGYVTFAWIFFRAETLQQSVGIISHLVTDTVNNPGQYLQLPGGKKMILFVLPLLMIDWYLRRDERRYKVPQNRIIRWCIYLFLTIGIINMLSQSDESNSFIYFQF